jgi:hypothetical protein
MRIGRAVSIVLIGLVLLAPSLPSPAAAFDQGNLGTVGPKHKVIELEGLPLTAIYPGVVLPTNPVALYRPTACRNITYCDTFEFDVEYPPELLDDELFGVSVTLTWENPKTKSNPNGNDLDLFLWPDDDPAAGFPSSKCQSPEWQICDELESETISVSEPDNTLVPDDDFFPYLFTVINHQGVNLGYKITIQWYTFELPPPPEFEPPELDTTDQQPTVSGPFDFAVTDSQASADEPSATPRKILVPGPDGELREIDLPFFAAGKVIAADDDGGISPWLPAAIVGALVLVGFSWLLVIRARRRDQEEY